MSINELSYLRTIVQEEDVEKMELARRNQSLKSVIQEEEDRFQHEIDFNNNVVDTLGHLVDKLESLESKADVGILTACELWEKTQNQPMSVKEPANAALYNKATMKDMIEQQNAQLSQMNKELGLKIKEFHKNSNDIASDQILLDQMRADTDVKKTEIAKARQRILQCQTCCAQLNHLLTCHHLKETFRTYADVCLSEALCEVESTKATIEGQQCKLQAQLLALQCEEQQWKVEASQAQQALTNAESDLSTIYNRKMHLQTRLSATLCSLEALTSALKSVEEKVQALTTQKDSLAEEKENLLRELFQLEAQWSILRKTAEAAAGSPVHYFEDKYLALQSEVKEMRNRVRRNMEYSQAITMKGFANEVSQQIASCESERSQLHMVSLYHQYAALHLTEVSIQLQQQREAVTAQWETVQSECEQLQQDVQDCDEHCQALHSEYAEMQKSHHERLELASRVKEQREASHRAKQAQIASAQSRLSELQKTAAAVRADLARGREIRDKCLAAVERSREEQRERLYQQRKSERLDSIRNGAEARQYQHLIKEARNQLMKEDKEYQQRMMVKEQLLKKEQKKLSQQEQSEKLMTAAAAAAGGASGRVTTSHSATSAVSAAVAAALAVRQTEKVCVSSSISLNAEKYRKKNHTWRIPSKPYTAGPTATTIRATSILPVGQMQAGKLATASRTLQQPQIKEESAKPNTASATVSATSADVGTKRFKLQARMRS